ncbi:hypothetical protein GCM10007304_39270 [Rhodococcoides trifolii]|uniref:Uncharacterized protein n=1 Tax=Rhodococcoides trifolii TaxID=908250 RepID=A0A917G495_9NOCA|nr:hypothetical protein GCM10007304_39270 [Rhodococcus trifolii]
MLQRQSLDAVVAGVANHLMSVDSTTVSDAYNLVLRDLVNYFDVDTCFLRHTDHARRASVMVAEWPPRENVPDPDPLGIVYFETDSVFGQVEHLTTPAVFRPVAEAEDYRARVEEATGFAATSSAVVPLVNSGKSIGMLGFAKSGDLDWSDSELNALVAIAMLLTQVQARIVAEDGLRFAGLHDVMTGMANRRGLYEHLTAKMAETDCVSVLFLDVDRLKSINDTYGHPTGDLFLRTIADTLRRCVGPDTMVARWGGDEFVIVLDADGVVDRAKALLREVTTAHVSVAGEVLNRTASIGIATVTPGIGTVDDLISNADQAVLAAKNLGGNAVVEYDPAFHSRNELSNDIELHLRSAIENGSLLLYFQPEVDLISDRITAVEALVRWDHPSRGMLPPSEFVPIAEASNLAADLGRWVLGHACSTYMQWSKAVPGLDITMRVNVSPAQLLADDFAAEVGAVLTEHGMSADNLCLEITEAAVVHDLAITAKTLVELRELGVDIAIDDFGTGYSSLSHLKVLPVDALKIDRAFVEHLGTAPEDRAIVTTIAALADAYGLDLIAEGVEHPEATGVLIDLGCHRAQGYLFSRPVPGDRMLEMLAVGSIAV